MQEYVSKYVTANPVGSACLCSALYRNTCNDLCIGQNVAMIRDTFVAFCCSPIHAEPTGFITSIYLDVRITSKKF